MKTIRAVLMTGILFALTSIHAFSQNATQQQTISIIAPYRLAISYFKTSNLLFPYAIKSVDRGSKEVLVQKARGVENVLQVKAGKENFKETNLTVITADGKLYSYLLNYAENPSVLNIRYARDSVVKKSKVLFSNASVNEADVRKYAEAAADEKRTIKGISNKKHEMNLLLTGLFIKDDVLYFQVRLRNHSNIGYDIDQLRFFIRDQKRSKRTASQEIGIKPVYIYNHTATVPRQAEQILVVALPKFTIPDKKNFYIRVMEKNGGRHLQLKIRNSTIVKAQLLTL